MSAKICRFCLRETDTEINIYKNNFSVVVELLTSLKIRANDHLPEISCTKCAQDIRFAFLIRKKIINSQKVLKAKLAKDTKIGPAVQVKIEPELVLVDTKASVSLDSAPNEENKDPILLKNKNEFMKCLQPLVNTHKVPNVDDVDKIKGQLNEVYICKVNGLNKKVLKPEGSNNLQKRNVSVAKMQPEICDKTVPDCSLKPSNNQGKTKDLKCEECNLVFKNRPYYRLHLAKHNKKTCELCGKSLRADNMYKHMMIHSSDPATCNVCGAMCKNFESLRGHMFYCHKKSDTEYVCEQCGKSFRRRSNFLLHRKKSHGGERNFKCTECGKAFFQKMFLQNHIRSIHEKRRPHVCEYCGKGFASRHGLRTHVRQHTNEAPFICTICDSGFRQKVTLKCHLKSKHGIEEECKVFCETCGRGFATELALGVHVRLHQLIKCPNCSENFAEQSFLDNHAKEVHGVGVEEDDQTSNGNDKKE
ncbi:zinc finger protein OZF-like [Cylas formicarius]|uniref:zinc finger protein OZF-like n=1 Tax=Cylas formicarius TaxID=197179 RepID=UPI0029585878|nr:zinc finger protein OZF-like [Cylas formicarius]